MSERDTLRDIEARCQEILRSPYTYKELPTELQRLQTLMKEINTLVREDVPFLVAEIKSLRAENKKLQALVPAAPTWQSQSSDA